MKTKHSDIHPVSGKNQLLSNSAYETWILLNRTRFAISRLRDIELAKIGLTPEQSAILQMLTNRSGKSTVTQLSISWFRLRHSVSTLVDRMQKQGLVKKVKYPKKKGFEIVVTEKGQNLTGKINTDSIHKIFSFISDEDRQRLSQYLKLLLIRAISLSGGIIELNQINLLNEQYDYTAFNTWRLLDSARSVISRLRNIELAKIGLSPEQSGILQTLINSGGKSTIAQLSILRLRLRHSVLTLVDRMQRQGLVNKIKYPKQKELEIIITEKGQNKYDKITIVPIDTIFSFLSPEEIQRLSHYLKIIFMAARGFIEINNHKSD
jgi:DNA-binding MarR family transcriptional regulator